MAETISHIKIGNQEHPIDAVTINGLTLTSEEKTRWNNKQDALTFDSIPTENSENLVKSGVLYSVITENEEVTAAAIVDINQRLVEISNLPAFVITSESINYWDNAVQGVTFNGVYVSSSYGEVELSETDPIFAASVAASITAADISAWNAKQDTLTFDSIPTENSNNLVKSGVLYSVITENELATAAALNDLNDRVTDLEDVEIPDVSDFITNSVNDLANYYLKSETYNKTEVENLVGAILQFHYEIAQSTASVSNPESNVLYLIGPTGSGDDKYEEYIYPNSTAGWTKIGDTSLDLSGYVTTSALNSTLSSYVTTSALSTALTSYVTTSVLNTTLANYLTSESDPIFSASVAASITAADISAWNAKQDALSFDSIPMASSSNLVNSSGIYDYVTEIELVAAAALNDLNDRMIDVETSVNNMAETDPVFMSSPASAITVSQISAWDAKQDAITFDSIPMENSDNLVKSGALYTVIVDNEEVTSAALNDLNDRLIETDTNISALYSVISNISSYFVFDSIPTENSDNLIKSGTLYTVITQNEYVAATAINDLNDRVMVLESSPVVTASTVASWGFLTSESDPVFMSSAASSISASDISNWNSKYSKPSTGIPASDLASGVIPTFKTLAGQTLSGTGDVVKTITTTSTSHGIGFRIGGGTMVPFSAMITLGAGRYAILVYDTSPSTPDTDFGTPKVYDFGNIITDLRISDVVCDVFIIIPEAVSVDIVFLTGHATNGSNQMPEVYLHADDAPQGVSVSSNIIRYYSKPSTGIPASDIASGVIPTSSTVASWGFLTSESDPVFASSAAASISAADISNWNSKQDVFIATYNVTSGQEIAAAITAGKQVKLLYDNIWYSLDNSWHSDDYYHFTSIPYNSLIGGKAILYEIRCEDSGVYWYSPSQHLLPACPAFSDADSNKVLAVDDSYALKWMNVLTSESDPVFASSVAASISAADISAWNAKQNALSFDSIPTENSDNLVKSGALYDVIVGNELVTASALNDLNNRVLDLEDFTESDPTVPAWAKASTKPSYTAQEVGALPASTVIPSVDNYFDDAVYDSNTKRINFKHGSTVKKYIDTTDFGGGISSINFNGTSATVSNGVASISVSIPEPLWVDQNTYFSTLSNAFSEYQQILMEFGDGTYYSNTDLVLRCTDKTRYNNQVAYHFTGSLYAPNQGKYYITDVILGEASGGACTVLSISHKEIPDTVTASTVASWGFLSSESDPVFASSVAASITAADISNWNSKTSNTGTVTGSGLTTDKIIAGNNGTSIKATAYTITQRIPSSGGDTLIPTYTVVSDAINTALTTVLKYKGTIGTSGDVTSLPSTHAVGDVYVVSTASTYAGKACEVGDYIICKTASSTANNAHWDVVNGENQVSNKSASLASAGSSVSIATVDGTDITISTPASWTGVDKTGTITGISMNGASKGTSGNVDLGTVITAVSFNGTAATVSNGSVSISESDPVFSASAAAGISAADITNWNSKTSNTGTITGISMNGTSKGTSGNVNLGTVVTAISFNGTAATISNGVASISANVLPAVSSADSGKILQVSSNGSWALVTPVSIYNGSSAPNNANGNNGDIYIQTS